MAINPEKQPMTARYTIAAALCALVAFAVFGSYALRPQPQPLVTTHIRTRFERTGTTLDGWGWTTQAWTGDDRPYQKIRDDVEKAIKSGQKPGTLIAAYKAQAEAAPQDPLAVFGWGYTAWRVSTWSDEYQQQFNDFTDLPDALAAPKFPRAYNYARLRFLIQAQVRAMPQLEELGNRLLKRTPNDVDVQYQLIQVLKQIPARPQNEESLRLAHELIKSNPKVGLYYQTLGSIYSAAYMDFGFKRVDADKAIVAFQKQLKLMSPDDPERPGVERAIKNLHDAEAQFN